MLIQKKFDYLEKLVLIGDTKIGKSDIPNRLMKNSFNNENCTTIGLELSAFTKVLSNTIFKCQLLDTAGQIRFRSIINAFLRSSSVIILCFDITQKSTFISLEEHMKTIKELDKTNHFIILLGTKGDLNNERQVSLEEINEYAKKNQLSYFECSSKTGKNVHEAFFFILRNILNTNALTTEKTEKVQFVKQIN